ncbi:MULTISPECIES: hypothetical protein [Yersinia]|uniref:Uncharacterized protein n=1 Tax=Yersinia ruckeri TaxID=29486 RepID=A0A0A8VGT8_YERRU|nr:MULTISPECIES: hypothetical protein [Yersinia]HDL8056097.1 hypothetical protein [Yersinia enterocolitica]EEP99078.1 hypothetical protein yruck0001_20840 [Yersinia ruckeri ATCC 29473]KGA49768.1 hypothetical protein DJ39_789 [Yersinia ruckeri ATCC 29473]MCK8593907.1 hypothetical protein [Yersinia ruckeri]MCK8598542.1 hypothetical protein [Yersinia ruckeri]
MGYKYKATMYYSDEDTEQFLRGKATKPNGKKSASHYLYALVSRERENLDIINTTVGETEVIKLYPQFTVGKRIDFSGQVSFSSFISIGEKRNKTADNRLKLKSLMDAIDNAIASDFALDMRRFKISDDKTDEYSFSVILKTEVDCYYNDDVLPGENYKGIFRATCIIINVSRSEWGRLDGKYDFEGIKYFKYEEVLKAQNGRFKGLCKIAEIDPRDKIGAFFIPVRVTSKEFPYDRIPAGGFCIQGVNVDFNKGRVKLKSMNTSQKERHFGSGIG